MNRVVILVSVAFFTATVASYWLGHIFFADIFLCAGILLITVAAKRKRDVVGFEQWQLTLARGLPRFVLRLALESMVVILVSDRLTHLAFSGILGGANILLELPIGFCAGVALGLMIWNDAQAKYFTK
jgi:hypothetical protein